MITVKGEDYGTAAEVAAELGGDVTEDMVRNWSRRDGLKRHKIGQTVYHPFAQAAEIEAKKSGSGRGRPRQLDFALVGP